MSFKVALVGTSQLSFYGNKEERFNRCVCELQKLLETLKADLYVYPETVITAEDGKKALKIIAPEKPDFLLVQCTSFSAGYLAEVFIQSGYPVGWWAIPENVEGQVCEFNSFCSINMYQAINVAYYNEEHYPAKWFFGEVGDPLFKDRLTVTVRALRAIKRVCHSKVGLIGGIAPGFNDLYFDERKLLRLFPGLEYDRLPEFDDIASLAESYPESEIAEMAEAFEKAATCVHPSSKKHKMLNARLLRAYREFIERNHYDALAVSCWPKFQDKYDYSVCSVVGQLNDDGIPTSCEGDPLSAVGMLMLQEISGESATLMDMSGFDLKDESVLMWHCGPSSANFASDAGYSLGVNYSGKAHIGGLCCTGCARDMVFAPGKITIGRLNADMDKMFVAAADVMDPAQKTSFAGSRGWVHHLRLGGEEIGTLDFVNTILTQGVSHHYPISKGDYQAELMEIAAWLKIGIYKKVPYQVWLQMK